MLFALVLVGLLIIRFQKHSNDVQRDQLKWLLLCAVLMLIAYAALRVSLGIPSVRHSGAGFLLRLASNATISVILIALPLAMFVAIFRQGLLNMEKWITRTLLYAAITAVLVATFFLINVGLSRAMEAYFGRASDLLTVFLALPMAIAFLPARRLITRLLDRFLSERRIMTIMFVDIVDSTRIAVQIGDEAWLSLLERFRSVVRNHLESFGGEEIDTAGDGFFATFVGPGGAIHCASKIVGDVSMLRISVRIGIHTGEVNRRGVGVTGVAVHAGARLMSLATPNEVLVSSAVRDLVAGSRMDFAYKGEQSLKGLPGAFRIYSLVA